MIGIAVIDDNGIAGFTELGVTHGVRKIDEDGSHYENALANQYAALRQQHSKTIPTSSSGFV